MFKIIFGGMRAVAVVVVVVKVRSYAGGAQKTAKYIGWEGGESYGKGEGGRSRVRAQRRQMRNIGG